MSYCIIGMKRTRSSVLAESISKFYDSDNYFAMWDSITPSLKDHVFFNKFPAYEKKQAKLDWFKKGIKEATLKVFNTPNSVIKLFPRFMIYHDIQYVQDHKKSKLPKNLDELIIITEIEEYFQLSKFNKIIYLERNITDAVASYCYAIYLDKFQFYTVKEVRQYNKTCKPITIDLNSPWIDFCIFEYMLKNQIKKYLDSIKLNYTLLNYDEIPHHCDLYYSGSNNRLQDSQFDYSKIIINYANLQDYINSFIDKNQDYVNNNIVFK